MKKFARFLFCPCLPLGPNGKRATSSKEHIALSRRAAAEGMVLLKNSNSTLPLEKNKKIALFGSASYEYIQGGGGSGTVSCLYTRSLYEGLKIKSDESKIQIFEPLCNFYLDFLNEQHKWKSENWDRLYQEICKIPELLERQIAYGKFCMDMQLKQPKITQELLKSAREYTDTAVMSVSRYSGEAWDRSDDKGDFYLSDEENELVDTLSTVFDNVIIVLNIGGVVATRWIKDNAKIKAALISWQGGMEGGLATADILCGDVTPSGKLSDTFAESLNDYPFADHYNDSEAYVEYNEDIYVGYRYFETIPKAAERVVYPFGYGLSYTDFTITASAKNVKDKITVAVQVKNTGKVSGKEVVQVYLAAPQGLLGKPKYQLAAFKKTKLLSAGEAQTLKMSFSLADFASFDDIGRLCKSAYILEQGDYYVYVGNSVRSIQKLDFKITVEENPRIVKQLESRCAPTTAFMRLNASGELENIEASKLKNDYPVRKPNKAKAPDKIAYLDLIGNDISVDSFIAQMSDDALIQIVGGSSGRGGLSNTSCFGNLGQFGIPPVPTSDGPAGIRILDETGIYTTCWPCATSLACTFNTNIIYKVAAAGAKELKENNMGVWLAPGMNIHRNPLGGRNFEYYSEDPLLTGKCASAAVKGIQSQRVAACIKHFAANNKEIWRESSDSIVSERALREIYLKGFEICVKEADPWSLMTSYNLLNGRHTSESYELLTDILRNEWGFNGLITTDWGMKNDPVAEVKAGNDIKMPVGYPEDLKAAMNEGRLTRADLEDCARHILTVFLRFE